MRLFLIFIFSLICAIPPLSAQGSGIEQVSDLVTVGSDKFLRWYGHAGRTYFIQVSDPNDHLEKWTWAPIIESGNDEDISYKVDGTADKGFFRLKYTDQPTTDPDNDDFDGDTISNLDEITYYHSDPLDSDSDNDGFDDGYESWWGTDPNNPDTDEDGLSDGDEYWIYGTYPNYGDSDGDGLVDGIEVNQTNTSPMNADSDSDGMNDGFEVTYWLDPLDTSDATDNEDSDGLNNLWEFKLGLNPQLADSNNNGVTDPLEDRDQDGLTNIAELSAHYTLPDQPDTDDDSLSDGWEILYGYSALVNNVTDADLTNDPDANPDNDGLFNTDEDQIGTNPNNSDTDGDGSSDLAEVHGGSNPTNAASTPSNPGGTPGGPTSPPPPIIPVQVNFGDQSDSHSEKYKVWLEPLEGDANTQKRYRTNRKYGQTQTETFYLPAGAKYKITLTHIGTDPNYNWEPNPDYDYTLVFTSNSTDPAIKAIPEDSSGMLGVHWESEEFFADGKEATLYVAWLISETVAQTPSDRQRVKLGVGEEVNLKVRPEMEDTTWTASVGMLSWETGSETILALRDDTGTAQVTAQYLGETLSKDFTVFAPTGVEHAEIESTISYPAGVAGAGMHLYPVVVAPTDVSFYNVQMLEVGEDASNITGYFTRVPSIELSHIRHGADRWFDLDEQNQWPSTWDYAILTDRPAPWDVAGSFTWNIPAKWRVSSGSTGNSGEHQIQGWTQEFSIQIGGAITIQKFGRSVTRTTSNVITTN